VKLLSVLKTKEMEQTDKQEVEKEMRSEPLISFCVFTYNQENFIEECLESVFKLKYNNLEIIISDDCSTDNTFSIITEFVKKRNTKHHIIINKNPENLGIGVHCFTVFWEIAKGDFIVTLGGDDVVDDENYLQNVVNLFQKDQSVMAVDINATMIDEKGNFIKEIQLPFSQISYTLDDYLSARPIYSFAPGRTLRNLLVTDFKMLNKDCPAEAKVLTFRALLRGKLLRTDIKAIKYRQHPNNSSSTERLRKISFENIIKQHLTDADTVYQQSKISDIDLKILHRRIKLDLELHNSIKEGALLRFVKNIIRVRKYRILKSFYKFFNT